MSKTVDLIKNINAFVEKASQDELVDFVAESPELAVVPTLVEKYEKTVARLLRKQKKLFIDSYKSIVAKDDSFTLSIALNFYRQDLFASDEFAAEFGEETAKFLNKTIGELSSHIMQSIDRDIAFEVLSGRTTNWIQEWSFELAEIMQLNTHRAVEDVLSQGIIDGMSIQDIELKLKDMPQFDRKRARKTAITEVLTASSRAQWESYMQSPAVTGKRWKHSGGKGIEPRPTHVELSETVVGVNEEFIIPESNERCQYPRDPILPASERVNCHCALGPAVDQTIIGLSPEEKEQIRKDVLSQLNG